MYMYLGGTDARTTCPPKAAPAMAARKSRRGIVFCIRIPYTMLRESRYGAAGVLALALTAAAEQPPRTYTSVTSERLKNPEDGDWLMVRRTYDGWGYSPLGQITAANVSRLQPAWVFATGVNNGHE